MEALSLDIDLPLPSALSPSRRDNAGEREINRARKRFCGPERLIRGERDITWVGQEREIDKLNEETNQRERERERDGLGKRER